MRTHFLFLRTTKRPRQFSDLLPLAMIAVSVAVFASVGGCAGGGGSYSPPPPPPSNPAPSLSANAPLSPSSATAGGPAFTLTVTGSSFLSSSTVGWNGSPRATTFVSGTSLQAAITAADIAAAGTAMVTVTTPSPGGGTSAAATFTINNPVPTAASLNPSSAFAGSAAFTLTVTGTNFVTTSTVQWNGTARTTTFVSNTSLQAAITAADIATAGTATVTVVNAAPGGGTSGSTLFTINNPIPNSASLSPSAAFAGGAAFTLTVTGTNFISSSSIQWNGSARTTTFVSSTSLQSAITAADLATAGTAAVTVFNPAPGGGTSSALTFTIEAPTITLLSPSSAIVGAAAFTLNVSGANFVAASAVQWNGSPRTTTFVSSTSLQAAITATDVAAIGTAKVTVVNPASSGGTSNPSTFFVGSSGVANLAAVLINQAAQDIAYDPVNGVFYLSVTGSDANHPNTISVLDPATFTITSSQPAGSNPNVLAISDNSQFLYAGLDGAGAVQRFTLPGLAKDINFSLGGSPTVALELQVAPGTPHTVAVAVGNHNISPAAGGITIFDDANPRPTKAQNGLFSSIQWGSDATTMFSANDESTGFDFYTLTVNSSGVTLNQDFSNRFSSFSNRIHFDSVSKLVYGDDGQVVDPSGNPAGIFDASTIFNASPAVMTVDSNLATAFFVGQTSSLGGVATFTIQSFDLAHFTPIASATVTGLTCNPSRLIRWSQNGLAFVTSSGQVFLAGGNFVTPAPPFPATPPPTPVPLPPPAANAPTITSLTPSSAIAGSPMFTLAVNGTNFNSAATVQFNGNSLATTFGSSTQLTAVVPATDISAPGTANITVSNPAGSGGLSSPSTFFIGASGGTSSAGTFAVSVLNHASNDIVLDPANRVIYLSVPGTAVNGNTVAVFDPATMQIVGEQFAGSNPNILAISDDSQFLYASIDGTSSVQRLTLPTLGSDIKYPLGAHSFFGPYTALDLQVAPAAPRTTAVTLGNAGFSPSAQGGITIFDDAVARPTIAPGFGAAGGGLFDSLQWGANATELFADNTDDSGFDFYVLSVTPTGVSLTQDFPGAADGSRIHFDKGTSLVYCDNGRVINPANGTNPGSFSVSGIMRMVPDSVLNMAFFVTIWGTTATVQSFNLTTRAAISSITIPNVSGNAERLIRWGQNGLAFDTDGGQLVLVGGSFVH
jgi:hypothetical protein